MVFAPPDGICLDAEGAVWVADPIGARVFRVREGGEVTDSIGFDDVIPVACVLGGDDRRTLLMCVAAHWRRDIVTAVCARACRRRDRRRAGGGPPVARAITYTMPPSYRGEESP